MYSMIPDNHKNYAYILCNVGAKTLMIDEGSEHIETAKH
jgi:hypothetical protein